MKRAFAAVVLLWFAGCAPYPYAPPAPRQTPAASQGTSGTPAGTTSDAIPVPRPMGNARAVIDTVPSRDAQDVLARIPEPLQPSERIAPETPPARPATPASTPAPADSDTTQTTEDAGAVPVPAATYPLGLEPPPPPDTTSTRDSVTTQSAPPSTAPAAPPVAKPAAPTSPPPSSPPRTSTAPDTCWRVQVAAPDERAKADGLRAAAESQLLLPMVVEPEKGLFKVRTRDCMSAGASDALRRRATESGFAGTFRFIGGK